MDKTLPRAKVSKNLFLTIAIIFASLRLLGDAALFEMSLISNDSFSIWRAVTSGIVLISLFTYFFKEALEKRKLSEDDNYLRESLFVLLYLLVLVGLTMFPARFDAYTGNPDNLVQLISGEVIAMFGFTVTFFALRYLYKWLWIRRHKNTKTLMSFMYYFFVIVVGLEIFGAYFNFQDSSIISNLKLLLNLCLAGFHSLSPLKTLGFRCSPRQRNFKFWELLFCYLSSPSQ
jgi:hypothetical protein